MQTCTWTAASAPAAASSTLLPICSAHRCMGQPCRSKSSTRVGRSTATVRSKRSKPPSAHQGSPSASELQDTGFELRVLFGTSCTSLPCTVWYPGCCNMHGPLESRLSDCWRGPQKGQTTRGQANMHLWYAHQPEQPCMLFVHVTSRRCQHGVDSHVPTIFHGIRFASQGFSDVHVGSCIRFENLRFGCGCYRANPSYLFRYINGLTAL